MGEKKKHTRVRLDLVYPLILLFLVLPITTPPVDPLLTFFVPDGLGATFFLDTFGCCEPFPFRGWFGFREGFGTREGCFGRGELREGAVGGWEGG